MRSPSPRHRNHRPSRRRGDSRHWLRIVRNAAYHGSRVGVIAIALYTLRMVVTLLGPEVELDPLEPEVHEASDRELPKSKEEEHGDLFVMRGDTASRHLPGITSPLREIADAYLANSADEDVVELGSSGYADLLPARPNILLVVFDDSGYGDLGVHAKEGGGVSHTPFLDDLSARGLRLTSFYAGAAQCAPSRAAMLTGRHGARNGVYGHIWASSR